MDNSTRTKIKKIALPIIIVISIIFIAMMWLLTYNEEGETNIPFIISKIIIVSSAEGVENGNQEMQWSLDVNQNNDIYIYIEKNKNYGKTELIENIKISNFDIKKQTDKGEIKIYKTTPDEDKMFQNIQEFEINEVTYNGDTKSNTKQFKISNQGDLIVFRCANNKISQYLSNEGTEINYDELLQKTNVNIEDLKVDIAFDLEIKILNKKTYQTRVELQLPVEEVITKGKSKLQITDLEDIVFKII